MNVEFSQIEWNDQLADDCRQLIRLALREDLERSYDWTTLALVDENQQTSVAVVAREPGVVAGQLVAELVFDEMDVAVTWRAVAEDGVTVAAETTIAEATGRARDLLTAERTVLNFIGRLSGIATLTKKYVDSIAGKPDALANIYDTRKTTPGWRRLEKYAVRCGGGRNHRTGLFDAILIKDNHLAVAGENKMLPADAVKAAQKLAQEMASDHPGTESMIVEVEVDTIEQFSNVLAAEPDIVLLDNMTTDQLRNAVQLRDDIAPDVELEASGGVNLKTVAGIAATGVDRISVGGLTHAAVSLDIGMDWTA